MSTAKIGVVIPLYNHERYIVPALRSVLEQSRRPARVIVVDDGSNDASIEAARKVDDPRIEILSQENRGAHAALNRGVALAEGCDYVAILNSDDLHHASRYEECAKLLEEDASAQLVCTRFDLIDDDSNPLASDHPRAKWFEAAWSPIDENLPLAEWLGLANFPATTSNFFARREWLLEHPFKPYRYSHDYYHLLEAAMEDALRVLPGRLMSYRVHTANTITTAPSNLIREMLVMNADLIRAMALRIDENPSMRGPLVDYQRSAWRNVSAFRQDLFTLLLACSLTEAPAEKCLSVLDGLMKLPEAAEFPNRAMVNERREGESLTSGAALAERFQEQKRVIRELKEERKKLREELKEVRVRLGSRADALRRLLGLRG